MTDWINNKIILLIACIGVIVLLLYLLSEYLVKTMVDALLKQAEEEDNDG